MSLINEALKKARHESSRKEDRRHGLPTPAHVRARRSVLPWVLTAGSLSLAIGVIVGVVLRSGGEDPALDSMVVSAQQVASALPQQSSTSLSQVEPPERASREVPPPHQADPGTAVTPASEVQQDPTRSEVEPAPDESLPPDESPIEATLERDLAVESPPPVLSETPATARAEPPPPGPRDGESFLRTVPLPGDRELVLNGIAWSDSGSVALINGRALEKGEYVDGWMLGLIERQQVELLKDEMAITVRLK